MESNKARKCKNCDRRMDEGQRDGALFCSDKCRVRYHRSKKDKQTDNNQQNIPLNEASHLKNSLPPLSGVLDNAAEQVTITKDEWEIVEVENPEFIRLVAEHKLITNQMQRNQTEQAKIVAQLKEEGWDVRGLLPWLGAGIGAVAGLYVVSHKSRNKKKDNTGAWENTGTVAGLTLLGLFILSLMRPDEETQKAQKLAKRNELVRQSHKLDEEYKNMKMYASELQSKQKSIPAWIPQRQQSKQSQRQQMLKVSIRETEKIMSALKTNEPEQELNKETNTVNGFELTSEELLISPQQPRILESLQPIVTPDGKPRLVNSMELGKMKFKRFNFQGRWLEFFGQPAIHFQCVIYGLPGSGKSTFAAQFANYLSRNFGKVVYIAGEEGISATLQDKVNLTGAKNQNLDFADVSHWQQLSDVIAPHTYNFMVLDSLHQLGIDEEVLRKLREQYPDCAFISINQSTKDGKMRGSNVIIHDADISIEVREGIAVCRKNRFQVTGREFQVLPKPPKTDFKEPDNII